MSNNIPMRYWPYEAEAAAVLADLRSLQIKMKAMADKLVADECHTPAERYLTGVENTGNAINAMKK